MYQCAYYPLIHVFIQHFTHTIHLCYIPGIQPPKPVSSLSQRDLTPRSQTLLPDYQKFHRECKLNQHQEKQV